MALLNVGQTRILFYVSQVWLICLGISLFAVASNFADNTDNGVIFSAVWDGLTMLALAVFGILVMLRYLNAHNFGLIVGATLIATMFALSDATLYGSQVDGAADDMKSSFEAATAFGALYFIFGVFLTFFLQANKDDFVKVSSGNAHVSEATA